MLRPEPAIMAPLTEHAVNSGNHSFVGDPTYTRSEPARPAQDAPSYQFRGSSFYGAKGSNLDFAMQADRAAADFAHAQAAAAHEVAVAAADRVPLHVRLVKRLKAHRTPLRRLEPPMVPCDDPLRRT